MKIFTINLDKSVQRLATLEKCFSGKTTFQRINATDGRSASSLESLGYSRAKNRSDYGRLLTKGEVGCYHSHLLAAKYFLNTDEKYCIVLEDDAFVDDRFFDFLLDFEMRIENLPPDLNILNLCNSADKKFLVDVNFQFDKTKIRLMSTLKFPTVARGILYSRRGASHLINKGSTISKPFDHFLKDWLTRSGGGYCLEAPVVYSSGFASDIGSGTSRIEQKLSEGLRYDFVVAKRDLVNEFCIFKRKYFS